MVRDSIFISYSHKDNKWLTEIKKHLSILEHNHQLVIWDDTKIKVGSDWKNDVEESIRRCKVAVLIVSNNFLASEFILKKELPGILNATKLEGVTIFNVIIDASAFHLTALAKYQCLNNPEYPLEELKPPERKRVLVNLTTKLLALMTEQTGNCDEEGQINLNENASDFCMILILADLIKNGPKSITDIQNTITLKRKIIVSTLNNLQKEGLIVKCHEPETKKKPSVLWKASVQGCTIFNQFETIYSSITNLTR